MTQSATHYARHGTKTICGRTVPKKQIEKEFGCVSCGQCQKVFYAAGMKAMGL